MNLLQGAGHVHMCACEYVIHVTLYTTEGHILTLYASSLTALMLASLHFPGTPSITSR